MNQVFVNEARFQFFFVVDCTLRQLFKLLNVNCLIIRFLEEQEVPSSPEKEKNGDVSDWSAEDDNELFQRMSRALPRDDTMKYESRVNHMDWEMVSFHCIHISTWFYIHFSQEFGYHIF